jgi:hypothetical protein
VVLTHPSPNRPSLSLGEALHAALRGPTASFNAVVGYFGHNTVEGVDGETTGDDPASIIVEEGRDGFEPTREDHVGFRLMTGKFFSPAAELAGRTWYWLCRWRRERPDEAEEFRANFAKGASKAFRETAVALFDPDEEGCLPLLEWTNDDATRKLELSDDEHRYWTHSETESFKTSLNRVRSDSDALSYAAILVGFFLQRQGELRVLPEQHHLEDGSATITRFHPKLYVVERAGDFEDTISFVGSNNWTNAGMGAGVEADVPRANVEVGTVHSSPGHGWAASRETDERLGDQVCRTARSLYEDEGLPLASWTEPDLLPSAEEAMQWTRCDEDAVVTPTGEVKPIEEDETDDSDETRTDLQIDRRVAALLEHMIEQVLGLDDPHEADDEDVFRSESTFGGLEPQRYQFDGATRLRSILQKRRGAFLTDEAGLGKTLVAKMVAAHRLASQLQLRLQKQSTDPVRLAIVAPARLVGEEDDERRDPDEATGWYAHALEIEDAVRQILERRLKPTTDVGDAELADEVESALDLLEWRVLSTSSFSRRLEAEPIEDGDYDHPAERIELRDEVVDDFFHVATSELVLVDESHNFRNPDSQGTRTFRFCTSLPVPGEDWEILPDIYASREEAESASLDTSTPTTRDRKLLCLSATPFNNRLEDLTTQIGHFGRRQNWELALDKRLESYTRGQNLLSAVEESRLTEHPLTEALSVWQRAGADGETDDAPLREAFETLLAFSHQHFESGRQLDVDDKKAEEKKQRTGEDYGRSRVSDRGPDYEWSDDYDELEHVFAHAREWFEHFEEHDEPHEQSHAEASVREARARLDSLLTDLVVQRSRARVLKIASSARDENVDDMFRRPRIPRHPLPLNEPGHEAGRNDASSFEADVLGALHRVLEVKTNLGDDDSDRDEETETALSLFPYEIGVRRGRAGQSGGAAQAALNTFNFQIVNLIKRLQSSPYSFMRTLLRGPLRKALFEMALVEKALHDDEVEHSELPDALADSLQDAADQLEHVQFRLTDAYFFEEMASIASMLGGSVLEPRREAAGDDRFYRRLAGCLDDTNQARDFEEAYDDFQRGLNGEEDHVEWTIDLLDDLSGSDSHVVRDVFVSLDWVADLEDGDAFPGPSLFDNLYDGLPRRQFRIRRTPTESVTWHGAPFPAIRQSIRRAEIEDNPETLVEPLASWLQSRFDQDERVLTLLSWLFVQSAVRRHEDAIDLDPHLRGGRRTLIFSEYTDTQEYLLAIATALIRVLQRDGDDGGTLQSLRERIVDSMVETADMLEARAIDIQNTPSADEHFTEPSAYEPPVSATWVRRWADYCRDEDYVPLAELADDLRETTGRICSDKAEYLFGDTDAEPEDIADSDAIHEARADHDADEADTTTVADDRLLDAFSPWYQIAPSADRNAEHLEESAERLTEAAKRPVHALFATEVLAEGVNLQECGVVVHYDLPWNPTHLIQRNGRVDRRIFDRYEEDDKRADIEANLRDQYEDFESPTFEGPEQVYHMTVVPVEPALDEDGDERANRVREVLFRKLQAIRALFGLSAWPVVLGADDAGKVLNGELDYETPGFRRREDLFAAWRRLHDHADGADPNIDEVHCLNIELPPAMRSRLFEAASGHQLEGEPPLEDTRWPEMQAGAVATWTSRQSEPRPRRSGVEYEGDEDVISGALFLGSRSALEHMIGWEYGTGPMSRKRFRPVQFEPGARPEAVSLATLEVGESNDDLAPDSPTALAEDLLVEMIALLDDDAIDAEIQEGVEGNGPVPDDLEALADGAFDDWKMRLSSPRESSYVDPVLLDGGTRRDEPPPEHFNLWLTIDDSTDGDDR